MIRPTVGTRLDDCPKEFCSRMDMGCPLYAEVARELEGRPGTKTGLGSHNSDECSTRTLSYRLELDGKGVPVMLRAYRARNTSGSRECGVDVDIFGYGHEAQALEYPLRGAMSRARKQLMALAERQS